MRKEGNTLRYAVKCLIFSDEFEKLILDAVAESKVFFIILTNDLVKIPQSLREKMRVIQSPS